MALAPRAGRPAAASDLINVPQLVAEYYVRQPDVNDPAQLVSFGTSGHRGSALRQSFNQAHVLAIAQAIVEVRAANNINGPCFVGKDPHALSEAALISILEVFAANQMQVIVQQDNGFTPTPAISHAILTHNQNRQNAKADGMVITPSHNPPEDGGVKYNPPNGGPADTNLTVAIQKKANELLKGELHGVKRLNYTQALQSGYIQQQDLMMPYVKDLVSVVDMAAIAQSGLKIGVDPLGGAGLIYWQAIADYYKLDLTLANDVIDPSFRFMSLDHDGVIRMDCSSKYAMAGLLSMRDQFDLALANDPDYDRHGIVTPEGLMDPNHYLAVAIDYLFKHRPQWGKDVAVGKTLVSSAIIDRVAMGLDRKLFEVPVGFKWFVDGLYSGSLGFAGEESAGASFLRFNGQPWSTDKDGIIMCLLAAEITAKCGKNPQQYYADLAKKYGSPCYLRIQASASLAEKQALAKLSPEMLKAETLAGDKIIERLTTAPGNGEAIGGLKIVTENGWFTARPSGTESAYKIYCESFLGEEHLQCIAEEAVEIVSAVLADG